MGARRITAEPRSTRGFARERGALMARIADLEVRLQLLEARVRREAAESRQAIPPDAAHSRKAEARKRPRCPGCLLELPKGRRGDACVWCGFQFDAVGGTFR